jgi:hypothetical protein
MLHHTISTRNRTWIYNVCCYYSNSDESICGQCNVIIGVNKMFKQLKESRIWGFEGDVSLDSGLMGCYAAHCFGCALKMDAACSS